MATQGISGAGRAELTAVAGRRRFVTPDDVAAELEVDPSVAAKKLAHWADSGWLRRVRRGLYIPVPVDAERPSGWAADPLVVATEVWGPCYFTGWTAASHWSLTEQVFRTIVLKTSRRVRAAESRLLDHDYLVSHVSGESMSWGIESLWREEIRVRFADPARTVVDVLDAPRLGGGIGTLPRSSTSTSPNTTGFVSSTMAIVSATETLQAPGLPDRIARTRSSRTARSMPGQTLSRRRAARSRRSDRRRSRAGMGLRTNVHVGRVAPS